jgi:hypothetical protein
MEEPTEFYWIGTYEYTSNFFNGNPQYKIGAEIGIAGGEHIKYLLKNTKIKKIYGIDPFDINLWNVPVNIDIEKHYNGVVSKLKRHKGRVEIIRKMSVEGAKDFEDESLDFVFIDAGHGYEDVRDDIEAWLPKVKKTGIIMGHDWDAGYNGVEQAVRERFGYDYPIANSGPSHVWYVTKENAIRFEEDHSDLYQPEEGYTEESPDAGDAE